MHEIVAYNKVTRIWIYFIVVFGFNYLDLDRIRIFMKVNPLLSASYIRQTRRNLINRLKEHSSSDKSEVCRHLMDNPDHKVDFAKPNILSSSGDSARLLILESLLFKNMSHCLMLTPNPLLFTHLIVNLTPSVFLLAFGL